MYKMIFALCLCALSALAVAEAPPGHPKVDEKDRALHKSAALPNKGQVLEFIDAGGYTYLHLEDKGQKKWIAVNKRPVSEGSMVRYSNGTLMRDFHSKSLDRTFKEIYFVGSIQVLSDIHPTVEEAEQILDISQIEDSLPNLAKVLSTTPSNNYTYIEVDQEGTTRWLAVPRTTLKEGAMIRFGKGAVMRDFYSKTMDRKFSEILFLGGVLEVEK